MATQAITIARLEHALASLAAKGAGIAHREALNDTAFDAMRRYKQRATDQMQIRSTWTLKGIKVDRAGRGVPFATLGSVDVYMRAQEFGDKHTPTAGAANIAIPTAFSAGQGRAASRTKLPAKRNKLSQLTFGHPTRPTYSIKQRNFVRVRFGGPIVMLETHGRKGIYRVLGKGAAAKVEMLYGFRKEAKRPNNPMLGPASEEAAQNTVGHYITRLEYQMARAMR